MLLTYAEAVSNQDDQQQIQVLNAVAPFKKKLIKRFIKGGSHKFH